MTTTTINRFGIGDIVDTGRGDYVWTFEVVARTAKFVTLRQLNTDKTYRVKIHTLDWSGETHEHAYPFGRYSMAPLVSTMRTVS